MTLSPQVYAVRVSNESDRMVENLIKRQLRNRRRAEVASPVLFALVLAMFGNLFSVGQQQHSGHIMITSVIGALGTVAAFAMRRWS